MTDRTAKNTARTPWQLRVWFGLTWAFAGLIRLLWQRSHSRMGADPRRFGERCGRPTHSEGAPVIWIHAASLGEVAQIGPLADHFADRDLRVLVTTTTQAGADWVAQNLPDAVHQFAPMDTPGAVRGFLDAWHMRAAIFVEGDFAPRLTLALQDRDIPTAMLNARHSRTRARLPAVFTALMAGFALVTCRSDAVADSIRALGVPETRVKVLPDLRIAAPKLPCPAALLSELTSQIGSRPVWLAASTHLADEEPVLAAHETILRSVPDTLLILAPRHPKRGAPLETAARARGFAVLRRSERATPDAGTQVYIADTLGEMGVFLSLVPVTFLGGSFGEEGGHNPYEPASFGTAILSGPNVKNFAEAFDALSQMNAAGIVEDPAQLGSQVLALMQSDRSQKMGSAGKQFMDDGANGMPTTIALLEKALKL